MAGAVTVTSFGQGRYEFLLPQSGATVGEALRQFGVEPNGRRVALNGHPADAGTGVLEGDEVTVVPKVHGG